MRITIDENGNVTLNTSFDTARVDTLYTKMDSVLATIKTFDSNQIDVMANKLNSIYPAMINFNQFIDEWLDVLDEVSL